MSPITEEFRKMFVHEKLRISMSELSQAANVSPSQIRYWERKGYIASEQDQQNKSHKYTLMTLVQVTGIKYFLDEGFTLPVAVKKQKEHQVMAKSFKHFIGDRLLDFENDGKTGATLINLGKLDDAPDKEVVAIVQGPGHVKLTLRNRQ